MEKRQTLIRRVQEQLFEMQDKDYRDFHSKLIPNISPERMIGVRTPALRKYAKQFGKRVANWRAQEGLLQKELATAIGVSNNHMSGIENGSAVFSFHVFLRLCLTLHVTPDYLLEGTTDSNNAPQSITDSLKLCSEADIKLAADFVDLLRERNI